MFHFKVKCTHVLTCNQLHYNLSTTQLYYSSCTYIKKLQYEHYKISASSIFSSSALPCIHLDNTFGDGQFTYFVLK